MKPRFRSIGEVPLLRDCRMGVLNYLEEPILVEGTLTGLTGSPGCGKSSLACAVAWRLHQGGRAVLILDRDNPDVAVQERFNRLGIREDPTFRVWGDWAGEEAPQPAAPIVLDWVKLFQPRPLVVIDSLSPFHGGDQNDAGAMRAFMNQCRAITALGGSVIVLHHDGKANSAKKYRGSSDYLAALDNAFHVTNLSKNGHLARLSLNCYKSRFGFSGEVTYDYLDGQLLRTSPSAPTTQTIDEKLTELLSANPGIGSEQFEQLAGLLKLGRNKARIFLKGGVSTGSVRQEPGTGNAKSHFLSVVE